MNLMSACCAASETKIAGTHNTFGDLLTPADTHALSILTADNRLMASAFRLAWEPIFNQWVSSAQTGDLRGRSMLANIIDIDEGSMTISLKERDG